MIVLPVSVGEAFDKYSILMIKSEHIKEPERLVEVTKEHNLIKPAIESLLVQYKYQYECLYRVNKEIWILTDEVKVRRDDYKLYETIFELNAMRFRIKSKIDLCVNSTVKEQKSYPKTSIFVTFTMSEIYSNINHKVRALSIMYDMVYLKCEGSYSSQIFKDDHQIVFVDSLRGVEPIALDTIVLPSLFEKYDFSYRPPYVYLMGGRLGDLIHLLYVIYVNYTVTGVKGVLYITNDINLGGDTFSNFERTYTELYQIIKGQPYIENFLKYNGESVNFNLNSFRYNPYVFHDHWLNFLSKHFRLPLLRKPWIMNIPHDPSYEGTVIIHRSTYQSRYVRDYELHLKPIVTQHKCLFITCDIAEYNMFPFKDSVPLKLLTSLSEMFIAINSCNFFIGNQSSPLAMAYALFKPMLAEFGDAEAMFYRGSEAFYPGFHYISNNENHIESLGDFL